MLMTKLPIIGKQSCRLWPDRALEGNPLAGHDGVWRSASSPHRAHRVWRGKPSGSPSMTPKNREGDRDEHLPDSH
jgi:hypothetical protein